MLSVKIEVYWLPIIPNMYSVYKLLKEIPINNKETGEDYLC
jgi:hypothetical protein